MAQVDFSFEDWDRFATMGVGNDDTEERRDALDLFRQMTQAHRGREVNAIMGAANDLLQYHGVEGLFIREGQVVNDPWDSLHGADYLNAGDTYTETLLYDVSTHAFRLTTMGDWVEAAEAIEDRALCVQCGEQFPVDELDYEEDGTGATCRRCIEKDKPPPTWRPITVPLITMLRSIEGAPIAVHLLDRNNDLMLGFSVPYENKFILSNNRTWPSIIDAFRRGQEDLYVASTRGAKNNLDVSIERDQFHRLAAAMDRFMEGGMKHQARVFLDTPPVLWTCDQVNEIQWIEGERGHGQDDGVQAFVRREEEVGSTIQSSDLVVWAVADDELQQLIIDGFIQWKNDRSVREYLQEIGVCRAK